ncbi:MFS transporter [Arthrobacter sp. zg-Y411]|uniref:MFS transporter n=1 Tax=Arthrobacter zhangbolii TaxID=2886936 RepID=UPI001D159029|nr:MFS transporter [Arthrobacter zhangbolii]MCC3295381.1 MFS transporter [Arthrobacter zhangbolii]
MPPLRPRTDRPTAALGGRTWAALVILGLTGQLAWTVENMYLNVFVYNTITDNPTVLAGMVAASAVTATVASLLVGSASDRLRRRRIFISTGYVLWGGCTAAFGFISVDAAAALGPARDAVVLTVVAVVALDCLLSFFGSGANDAAFNAWVTDSTVPANRGRVDSVLSIMPLLSMLVVFGALDGMTRAGMWQEFFAVIGLTTAAVGVLSWFLVREHPDAAPGAENYLRSLVHGLRPSAVRDSPGLYLVLAAAAVLGIAAQIFLPYLIIYLQRFLRIENYALPLAVVLVAASVASVAGGRLIDRIGKIRAILPAAGVMVVGAAGMFFARGQGPVMLAGTVMMAGFLLATAAVMASVRDFTPPGRAGNVQGLRMIFAVMIPMVVGPFIGSAVIIGANETYLDLGVLRQVPTPWIFLAAAAVALLTIVPVYLLHRLNTLHDTQHPPAAGAASGPATGAGQKTAEKKENTAP